MANGVPEAQCKTCVSVANKKLNAMKPPEHAVWASMKDRCGNRNNNHYARYGGRGIKVCARWASFAAFMDDMGKRPSALHTLDRTDNDGDYEPSNCRWVTVSENCRNKSNTLVSTDDAYLIMRFIMLGISSGRELARIMQVPDHAVYYIQNGRNAAWRNTGERSARVAA